MSNEKVEEVKTIAERVKEIPYWYHSIELPGGIVTSIGGNPIDANSYGIADDFTGKRILDIGTWDGYWTWDALKRGAAEVVAIDNFTDDIGEPFGIKRLGWESFDICREAFGFTTELTTQNATMWKNNNGQTVRREEMSVYDIESLGEFDVVFFFGTIYHLQHPLVALQKIASVCTDEIYIESAICDDFSPYRGGLGGGYSNNDMVMEFYPENQYGDNKTNWWVPTLQCLGNMVKAVGFQGIQAWGLNDKPKTLPECRGFVHASKSGLKSDKCTALEGVEDTKFAQKLHPAAVMSVPRLGFMDNLFCIIEGVIPHKIPILKVQGAFWGQCLERAIQTQIDYGFDAILTIDYDTIFSKQDVETLINIMETHPDIDILIPVHVGRSGMKGLCSMKTISGQVNENILATHFEQDLIKVATGHFGLTLIRTSAIMKIPHPWFEALPGRNGQWGKDRVDADINFWVKAEKAGLNVAMANRVVVGHMELMITWPDAGFNPFYQSIADYQSANGEKRPPANAWK